MSETVAEWKKRKREQARRIQAQVPDITIEHWQDYNTRVVLVKHWGTDRPDAVAVTIGQLPRDAIGQPAIDLTDAEILEALRWTPPTSNVR